MEKVSARIPSLDGLRTISIALVVISHIFHSFGKTDILFLGNLGVRVFFVISGFLITGLLLKETEKHGKINLTRFYFRRTFRIFPPFYFYLSVMFLLALLNVFEIPLKSFLYSAFYISNYFDPIHWNLTHTWSLSVEEQFYLLFPGILFLFGKRKSEKILLAIVVLTPFIRYADYIIFQTGRWMNMGFHQTMDALAIGCLLAMFYERLHANKFYLKLLDSKSVILLPILILFCNLTGEHPKVYALACSVMNISIAFCIDWAVTNYRSNAGKILNSKPMITLGMMSYSIYLWQQPFFEHNPQLFWTRFPFNFIGLAVMSLISYHFVEKHFLKLRPKFEEKLLKPKTVLQQKTT